MAMAKPRAASLAGARSAVLEERVLRRQAFPQEAAVGRATVAY